MVKYISFILIVFYSTLFAQTEHKSILLLKSESKQLFENAQLLSDSINTDKIFNKKHSGGNIAAQAITGSLIGLGAGFISFGIAYGIAYRSNNAAFSATVFFILIPSSLVFGEAIGVHLVAKSENPKHSFWQTVKYSAYGAGGGVALSLLFAANNNKVNGSMVAIVALTPLIGSLIYSNYIAEWPDTNPNVRVNEITSRNLIYSFKDYYKSTQLFRINILSIAF